MWLRSLFAFPDSLAFAPFLLFRPWWLVMLNVIQARIKSIHFNTFGCESMDVFVGKNNSVSHSKNAEKLSINNGDNVADVSPLPMDYHTTEHKIQIKFHRHTHKHTDFGTISIGILNNSLMCTFHLNHIAHRNIFVARFDIQIVLDLCYVIRFAAYSP